jgi:cyclophilin family peptidyl-prolyl cis-trans isomerase
MRPLLAGLAGLLLALPASAANPVVRFTTPLGSWEVELCAETSAVCLGAAPNTVANFLGYVDSGAYAGALIHRSVNYPNPFVIQGGSFRLEADQVVRAVPTGPAVQSEFNQSNVRGTMAVPLVGNSSSPCDTQANSGTSGWFISVVDNSFLDCGLFTVFGVVLGDGMQVVDAVNLLQTWNLNDQRLAPLFDPIDIIGAFGSTPLASDFSQMPVPADVAAAFVTTAITRVPEPRAAAGAAAALCALALLRSRRARRRC